MDDEIPDIDKRIPDRTSEEAEYATLQFDHDFRTNYLKSKIQDYRVKWIALIVLLLVVVSIGWFSYHLLHKVLLSYKYSLPPAALVALILAPIVSVTTLTIVLFVGAFRGFREKDIDKMPTNKLASTLSKSLGLE